MTSDYTYELLGGNTTAVLSAEHTFGTDAVLLAAFAAPKKRDIACDMGTGCGIIPLMWCRDGLCKSVTALDISESACEQVRQSVKLNNLSDKLNVVCGDLRHAGELLTQGSFDIVTMNPPYFSKDSGKISSSDGALIARHEVMCSFDEVARAAGVLLKFGGYFCVCHRPERLTDVMCAMRHNAIEPKTLCVVAHTESAAPRLILVRGKKGGKPGLKIEPRLILKNSDGKYTSKALELYGAYVNKTAEVAGE